MTPTKEDIKKWLKDIGKSREWLAKQCSTEKGTVNNWLSPSGPFPAAAVLKIQQLMASVPVPRRDFNRLVLEVSEERMKLYEMAALQEGKPLREWLVSLADCAASNKNAYEAEILGNIAAGELEEGDAPASPINIYRPLKKGEYIVRVNGRSMEPDIPDGALIVLKKYYGPDIPKVGTIVEYNDGRGVTLKRLGKRGDDYVFESSNPAYPVIELMDGGSISALYVETLS